MKKGKELQTVSQRNFDISQLSDEDKAWFDEISKKSYKKQINAMKQAIADGNIDRMKALLSIPLQKKFFKKTGIDFDKHKEDFFIYAIKHNQLAAMKTIVKHNNGEASSMIDNNYYGSISHTIWYDKQYARADVVEFLIKNGADPFKNDLYTVKEFILGNNIECTKVMLDNMTISVEPIKKLLSLSKHAEIYDILETKLLKLEAERAKKISKLEDSSCKTKKLPSPQNKNAWFPVGDFQIIHSETSSDPLKTTIRHIFNFETRHMTRCITDSNNTNLSETFRFSTMPEAKEFIKKAHSELKKHNPNLPPINRVINKRQLNN